METDSLETTQEDEPDSERIPLLHQCFPRVRPPARKQLEAFVKEHDIEIVQGKFSTKEDKKIKRNFIKFCENYDLTDCSITRCALLGFTVEDEDHVAEYLRIKEFVRGLGFYYWLARKLPKRLISAVYNRARKLLHPFRKQSELTQSEKLEVINTAKSMKKCKNMYSKIGNIYNCAPRAIQKIINSHLNLDEDLEFNKGKWQPEETYRLIQAILDYFEIDVAMLTTDHLREELPWVELSKKVTTRCADSCKAHALTAAANLDALKADYTIYFKL